VPTSIGDSVIYAVAIGGAYMGAAALLSRLLGRMNNVQSRPALAMFLLGGVLTSVCVSLVTVLDLWATGLVGWQQISEALTHATIGSLLGIYSVTPFLILVVAPQLQNVFQGVEGGHATEPSGDYSKVSPRLPLVGVAGGFALLGVIIMLAFAMQIDDRFLIFCFLLPPFLGVALLAGLEVFAAASFGAVISSAAMQWDFQFAFQQTVEFQALLLLVVLNGMLVGTIVSEKKVLQGTDSFRDGVLDSVVFAARRLAGVDNWEDYFTEVLRSFGEASKSDSVCLFEAWPVKSDYKFEALPYEWTSRKYSIDNEQSVILNRLRGRELARRTEHIGLGEVWRDPPASSTPEERALWTASGIRFTLIVPVRVEQELWGCLVLGRTEEQEDWSKRQINTIRYAVGTLGSLLASAHSRKSVDLVSRWTPSDRARLQRGERRAPGRDWIAGVLDGDRPSGRCIQSRGCSPG
jgi:GAF domain-containing protein